METPDGSINVPSYERRLREVTTSGDGFTLLVHTFFLEAGSLDHRMADDPG